jgi:hypothetical protein
MVVGTVIAHSQSYTPTYELSVFGAHIVAYTAIWALLLNFLISIALTLVLRSVGARDTPDETAPSDYDEPVETRPPDPCAGIGHGLSAAPLRPARRAA